MKKERAILPVGKILLNEGQLDWLPRNPRTWTQTDIDNTAASILEDEDFLEERPILVVPFNKGTYIAFAGNLRHEGAVATKKVKKVPCVIHYPETAEDYETVKRRAIKDNGSFGKWDTDIAANEWGDIPWAAWGAPDWMGDAEGQAEGGAEGGSGLGGTRVSGHDDDYDPDQKVNERVKRGEIWALGHHRLMCGDSTNPADVERLMGGGIFRFVAHGPAVQCELWSKHDIRRRERRQDNHERQHGGFRFPSILAEGGQKCRGAHEARGGILYLPFGFRGTELPGGMQRGWPDGPAVSYLGKRLPRPRSPGLPMDS